MSDYRRMTPGPWGIERTKDALWIGPLRKDGKVYAIVAKLDSPEEYREDARERVEAEADAIAAVPELVEILDELVFRFETHDLIAHPHLGDEEREEVKVVIENAQKVLDRLSVDKEDGYEHRD